MRALLLTLASALVSTVTATAQPSPPCKPVIEAAHRQTMTPSHEIILQNGHATGDVIYLPDAIYMKFPQGRRAHVLSTWTYDHIRAPIGSTRDNPRLTTWT